MSVCSSCGAAIIWAQTEAGKAMPLDAEPKAEGNIQLVSPADPREADVAVVLPRNAMAPMPRYVSHFATCPHADQHRRRA